MQQQNSLRAEGRGKYNQHICLIQYSLTAKTLRRGVNNVALLSAA